MRGCCAQARTGAACFDLTPQQIERVIGEVVEVAVAAWTGGLGSGCVLALTDRRLIFYRSHVLADAECQSIPRSEIQGADVHEDPTSMDLRIDSSSGRVSFKGIRPKQLAWQILGRLVLLDDGSAGEAPGS